MRASAGRVARLAAAALASAVALGVCARMERAWLPLLFVTLVPWLAALDGVRSLPGALGAALFLALAWTACVFGWFAPAIVAYTGTPLGLAWLVLLALAPWLEPQLFAFALARRLARGAGPARAATAAALAWVGAEWALPKLFADSLGHGLLPSPWLRQAADLAGVGPLTLVVLLVNECALLALRAAGARRPGRALVPLAAAACLLAALGLYGALRLRALDAELARAPRVTAGIVQAGIARYGQLERELGSFEAVAAILEAHFDLSHTALLEKPVDLLIWPETVYPTTFGAPKSLDGAAYDRTLGAWVGLIGVPLVFGAYDAEDGREYNAAILLEPDGPERVRFATYRKAALFPLTERIPGWLDSSWLRTALPWLGSWSPGTGARSLPLEVAGRSVRVAPLICYDALAPSLVRDAVREGAELIVTLSNDAWFTAGAGARLHLAMAAFRSLETGRAQLRATPTGISAAISPTGEVLAQLGVHDRAALVARVPLRNAEPTLFVRLGDWLGAPAALAACGLTALGRTRRARQPN